MKKLTSLLFLLLLVILPLSAVNAQLDEDENVFTFNNGVEFEIPEDWEVIGEQDDWYLAISDETTSLFFVQYFPEELEDFGMEDTSDLLEGHYSGNIEDPAFDDDEIEEVELAGMDALRYTFVFETDDGTEFEEVWYAVIAPDDYGWIIGIYPSEGGDLETEDETLEIALVVFEEFEEGAGDGDDDDDGGDSGDGETFEFNDGSVFEIPEGWIVLETNEDYSIEIQNDELELGLFLYQYYPETIEDADIEDTFELVEDYYNGYDFAEDNPFDEDEVEEVEFAGYDGAQYLYLNQFEDVEFETLIVGVILDNGYGMIAGVYPLFEEELSNEDEALDIAEEFIEGM
jgi:hypothetical protein